MMHACILWSCFFHCVFVFEGKNGTRPKSEGKSGTRPKSEGKNGTRPKSECDAIPHCPKKEIANRSFGSLAELPHKRIDP